MKTWKTCSVEGCDRTAAARGWCMPHYMQWYHKTGRPKKLVIPAGAPPTPHDQITFVITSQEVSRFRQLAERIIAANMHAAARYRAQNARDDAAEHAMAAD